MKAKSLNRFFSDGLEIHRVIGKWRTFQRRRWTHRHHSQTFLPLTQLLEHICVILVFCCFGHILPGFRMASSTVLYEMLLLFYWLRLLWQHYADTLLLLDDSGLSAKRKEIVGGALSLFRWIFFAVVVVFFLWCAHTSLQSPRNKPTRLNESTVNKIITFYVIRWIGIGAGDRLMVHLNHCYDPPFVYEYASVWCAMR